jgi:hypothetical protein
MALLQGCAHDDVVDLPRRHAGALEAMTIPATGFEQPRLELAKAGVISAAERAS